MRLRARVVTAAIASAALTTTSVYAAIATPWPQGGHDAALSRANAGETSFTAATIGQARYLRSITTPPQQGDNDVACTEGVQTEPLLVGSTVYAVGEHRLTAHNVRTGALRWSVTLDVARGVSTYTGLAYAGGRVLLASQDGCVTTDPAGSVDSYDAATGALQWRDAIAVGQPIDRLLVSGTTVVAAGASLGSGATVTALNLADGTVRWSRTDMCLDVPRVAVVAGRVVYTACDVDDPPNPRLMAVTLGTGATSWTQPGSWSVERGDSDQAGATHHLYVGSSAGLVDVNPANGATRYTIAGSAVRSLAVDATRVYVTCPAGLCAHSRATGARLWSSATTGSLAATTVGSDIVVLPDGRVLRAGNGSVLRDLWTGPDARWLSLGAGYLASVTNERVVDLFGRPGR